MDEMDKVNELEKELSLLQQLSNVKYAEEMLKMLLENKSKNNKSKLDK